MSRGPRLRFRNPAQLPFPPFRDYCFAVWGIRSRNHYDPQPNNRRPKYFFHQRGAQDIGKAQRTLFEEEWTVAEPMAAQRLPECALPIQVLGRDFEVALPAARASI